MPGDTADFSQKVLLVLLDKGVLAIVIVLLGLFGTSFVERYKAALTTQGELAKQQGGWHQPILDVIWPDWTKQEKERVLRTLSEWMAADGSPILTAAEIASFVEYVEAKNLEGFFWRLNSFEQHAFSDNAFALEGMKSDLQGMAVAVEHIVRSLGGTNDQLYEMFKQLWNADVVSILKRGDVRPLAIQKRLSESWPKLKAAIEKLRSEGVAGNIAAELVMAYRIRGGVHYILPEDDQLELERLFVILMRAAALTHSEVFRARGGA
jgi:hypothetical protein